MKKILFFTCITLCALILTPSSINAQVGPPVDASENGGGSKKINSITEIPGISLKQRLDIGPVLLKEEEKINTQMRTKERLSEKEKKFADNEKKKDKIQGKIEKTDKKILKYIEKSNKKVRKILTDEQYRIFIDNRAELLHRTDLPTQINNNTNVRPRGERPPSGGRPPDTGGGRRFGGGGGRR